MSDNLNFAVVSNNSVTLDINVLDASGSPMNATALAPMSVKWSWYIPNNTITKTTAGGTMSVTSYNPLVLSIPILSSETIASPQGTYPHEAVTVDVAGNPVTITNDDPQLSYGVGYLRKQLTAQ